MKTIIYTIVLVLVMAINGNAQKSVNNYQEFRAEMTKMEVKERDLRSKCWGENAIKDLQKRPYEAVKKISAEKRNFAQKYIDEHRDDANSLKILNIYVRNYLTLNKYEEELNKFSETVKNCVAGKKYFSELHQIKITQPGQKYLDFELTDKNGKKCRLSDFVKKNKYVLIDFWASWCGACRADIPGVKKLYEKYKTKGLEIIGVSYDSKRDAWLKAQKEENLPYPDFSDLKGWKDKTKNMYGIRGIPEKIIISKKGIIVARGLGGTKLDKKLKEMFGE